MNTIIDDFSQVGIGVVSFEIEGYVMTTDGFKFDRTMMGYSLSEQPTYYYNNKLNFSFAKDLSQVAIRVHVEVYSTNKDDESIKSPLLASIDTLSVYKLVNLPLDVFTKTAAKLPSLMVKMLAVDAMTATRGALCVQNMRTPLFDAVLPMAAGALTDSDITPNTAFGASVLEETKPQDGIDVLFDIYEYEDEIMPGMPLRPTYGVEAINHKPHAVRVTDHYLEEQVGVEWKKIEHVYFEDHSDRKDWEEGGNLYTRNLRKLPKILEPNTRFLWRIVRMPVDKDMKIRGVIVADKKPYYSEPYDFKSPSRQARAARILSGEEDLKRSKINRNRY